MYLEEGGVCTWRREAGVPRRGMRVYVPEEGRRVYLEEGGGYTRRSEAGLPGGGRRVDRVEGRRRQLPGVEDEAEGDEEEGVDEVEVEVEEDSHLAPAGPPSPTRQSNNQPV